MLMPTVRRYMTREPYSVSSTETLARARTLMRLHQIRHLPVVDGSKLVGVVSDRDVAVVEAVPGIDLAHVEISRVMEPALTAWSEEAIDEVSLKMASQRRDCVVIHSGHGVAGVFTATDALQALADIARRATA
jgi:acetoin utilization protein AcuB